MPFKSKAQQRFMFAKHPEIAEEFAAKTKSFKSLPEHVKKKKAKGGSINKELKHTKAHIKHEQQEMRMAKEGLRLAKEDAMRMKSVRRKLEHHLGKS